jgi:hypothetical protein
MAIAIPNKYFGYPNPANIAAAQAMPTLKEKLENWKKPVPPK